MKDRFVVDGMYGVFTLQDGEQLSTALLNDIVVLGLNAQVLNVDILIPIERVNAERSVLEAYAAFTWSGTIQRNEAGQAVTYACFRRAVRQTGSTDGLATSPLIVQPTKEETVANELIRARYGSPLSSERLDQLRAMGRQPDAPEKRDPVLDKLRAEISRLESEL
jgi:hypothetical protein